LTTADWASGRRRGFRVEAAACNDRATPEPQTTAVTNLANRSSLGASVRSLPNPAFAGRTVEGISELDLSYTLPLGSP
jgi:hypothetical protein